MKMCCNSKVCPSSLMRSKISIKERSKNIGKWIIVFASIPMTYILIPVSCCIRNPAIKIIEKNTEIDNNHPLNQNLSFGVFSVMTSLLCCGCCCGYCGKVDPVDF